MQEAIKQITENRKAYLDYAYYVSNSNQHKEDLYQEMLLAVLEYDQDKLKDIYERGILDYFCKRIIYISWTSPRSPFYEKFRKFSSFTCDIDEVQISYSEGNKVDELMSKVESDLDELKGKDEEGRYLSQLFYYYRKGALGDKRYYTCENQSMRELSKNTGICVSTISNDIQKVKEFLKKKNTDIA